jgi:hypothetical protein
MYGKHFESMYSGSMVGSGPAVFAVWGYIIAHAKKGYVEINPIVLATIIGCSIDEISSAINHLCSPDPHSRTKDHEGKRLIKTDEFAYFVPSHEKYNSIRSEDERREYNRIKKQEERAKKGRNDKITKNVNDNFDSQQVSAMSAHTDTDTDTDTETEKERVVSQRFVKPKIEEIAEYVGSINFDVEPKAFFDFYESNGWKVGKNAMKDWKAAIRSWKQRQTNPKQIQGKTKLFPIPGKNCHKCKMPAVYRDSSGSYDSYLCTDHLPERIKEKYC